MLGNLAGDGWVIGLDIGGTRLKAVLVRPDGVVAKRENVATLASEGPQAVLERAVGLLERIRCDVSRDAELTAVGLAVTGLVDEDKGMALFSVNLGWDHLELARAFSKRLGVPTALGHDVRLGGFAEGVLGAARGVEDFLFVPVGTGIGAALVLDGKLRRGATGSVGELGHLVVEPEGPPCGCGGRGCLEVLASAAAIGRRYRDRVPGEPVGAAEVFALAERGDRDAADVWASAIGYLGAALALVQSMLDLELMVIGGGLANAGPSLLRQLGTVMASRLPRLPVPRLVSACLGDDAACLGAALLARTSARPSGADRAAPSRGELRG